MVIADDGCSGRNMLSIPIIQKSSVMTWQDTWPWVVNITLCKSSNKSWNFWHSGYLTPHTHTFIQTFKVTHWTNYHISWETEHNLIEPVCAGSLLTSWHMIVVGSQARQIERVNMPVAVASLFVQTCICFLTAVHNIYAIYYHFLHAHLNTVHYLTYLTM